MGRVLVDAAGSSLPLASSRPSTKWNHFLPDARPQLSGAVTAPDAKRIKKDKVRHHDGLTEEDIRLLNDMEQSMVHGRPEGSGLESGKHETEDVKAWWRKSN